MTIGLANDEENGKLLIDPLNGKNLIAIIDHMDEKYSRNGYIKLWIPNSPNEKALNELRNIIEDKTELRKYFEEIYEELRKKKS